MKAKLKLIIHRLHACPGDGMMGTVDVSETVYTEQNKETKESEINEEIAETRELSSLTKKDRIKKKDLVLFRADGMYRLGGPYGKIAGLFKAASKSLWSQKIEGYTKGYKTFIRSMKITPFQAKLTGYDKEDIIISTIPQITAGISKALIIQYFQSIPICETEIDITMPSGSKKNFLRLLNECEGMPFGPKSRGEIEIKDVTWIEE